MRCYNVRHNVKIVHRLRGSNHDFLVFGRGRGLVGPPWIRPWYHSRNLSKLSQVVPEIQ